MVGGVLGLEWSHDERRGWAPDAARGFGRFWRWGRGGWCAFGARAWGEFEAGGWVDAQHVAKRTEAAREQRVGGDEGLRLGLIQQDEQMAALGADVRAGEHEGEPAEIAGWVEFIRAGFWVCGWIAGCGALMADGHGPAHDEDTQAVVQADEAARDGLAQRERHVHARGIDVEALRERHHDAREALGDGKTGHAVSYNDIRQKSQAENDGAYPIGSMDFLAQEVLGLAMKNYKRQWRM